MFVHAVALLALLAASSASADELFADPVFSRGFNVTAAKHPAPKIELGPLQFPSSTSEPPAWRLAQWGSRHLLQPGLFAPAGGADHTKWLAATPGKRVVVERPAEGETVITLEVNGAAEYGSDYRRKGEMWPHLLIEQKFDPPLRPASDRPRLSLEFRVVHCQPAPGMTDGLDTGLHTAQVSAYFTVHNVAKSTPDPNAMIWFGIPLFDARHKTPPGHYALDTAPGGGGKFICNLDGDRFWQGDTGDGQWRRLDADLAPLLQEALQIAQQHGHLQQSRIEDLALTSFNLGWELPGPYNAAIQFRNISLQAASKPH